MHGPTTNLMLTYPDRDWITFGCFKGVGEEGLHHCEEPGVFASSPGPVVLVVEGEWMSQ